MRELCLNYHISGPWDDDDDGQRVATQTVVKELRAQCLAQAEPPTWFCPAACMFAIHKMHCAQDVVRMSNATCFVLK